MGGWATCNCFSSQRRCGKCYGDVGECMRGGVECDARNRHTGPAFLSFLPFGGLMELYCVVFNGSHIKM